MSHFLEIDTTPSDEACIILHHHYGDASGPITGDYKCATSWKYTEAFHQLIHEDDDVFQTLQTLYGCGPRTLDGSVWNGDFWCDAVDATGEYVGWCDCEPASSAPSSAPTKTSAPTPAPAAGALGSDGARKTTIHYLGAATLLFLAF